MAFAEQRVALVACLAVVVSSLGVPLPAPSPPHSDELYPCAHCGCGCTDAETCWRQCCCYTNEQKLAWAKRQGVTPPAFVIAAAAGARRGVAKHEACCESADCHPKECERDCCARRKLASCSTTASAPRETRTARGYVIGISALRCRGLSLTVCSLPPTLPLAGIVDRFRVDDFAERICIRDRLYQSPTHSICTPPPDAVTG